MANEKRLIDASQENIKSVLGNYPYYPDEIWKFSAMAERFPTVDAVEVVRCKDCRFCRKHPTSDKVKLCTNENWNTEYHPLVNDNDFCSRGERRTDDA